MRQNTNIQLKRAEYSLWQTKYKDYVPLRGEPCIAFNVGENKDIQLKIGDGVSTFEQLQFLGKNNAVDIRYDNSKSGLAAENVQEALDELQTVLVRDYKPTIDDAADLGDFWVDSSSQTAFQLMVIVDGQYTWKQLAYVDTLVKEAESAKKLSEARKITFSNDATGEVSFDGTADVNVELTLKDVVDAGEYSKVQVDSKGRIIAGAILTQDDLPDIDSSKILDIDEAEGTTLQDSLKKIKEDIVKEAESREEADDNIKEYVDEQISFVLSEEVTFKGIVEDQTKLPAEKNTNGDLYWIKKFVSPVPDGMNEGRSGAAIYSKAVNAFQFTEDAIYQPDNKTIILNDTLSLTVQISKDENNAIEARENGLFVVTSHLVPKTTTVNGHALDQNVTLVTTDIAEGDNLYYTEDRVKGVVQSMSSTELTDTDNILYATDTLILDCGGAS